jgi:hypothetical protein
MTLTTANRPRSGRPIIERPPSTSTFTGWGPRLL